MKQVAINPSAMLGWNEVGTEDVYGRRDHFAYLNQRQTIIHCLKTLSQRAQLRSCAEKKYLSE